MDSIICAEGAPTFQTAKIKQDLFSLIQFALQMDYIISMLVAEENN